MREDTFSFTYKNLCASKDPRYTIELAFDSDNTILRYLTSHSDSAIPTGATSVLGTISKLSGTSQKLDPDKANSEIGVISFDLVDKTSEITDLLGDQLELGRSTRRQRVRVYVGYEGLAWEDYTLIQTQLVSEISFDEGTYHFKCVDVQRELKTEVFENAITTLATTLTSAATTVEVYDTSQFVTLAHGTSFTDAPSTTVGYIKIEDEIIKYTGKTATTFTGCTRGALNTLAVAHTVDSTASEDRRTPVTEYVYLEMPAAKLAYAVLTGKLLGQGTATLPDDWHLGIESESTFDDSSANGLDATISGALLSHGHNRVASSLLFDGVDDIATVAYNALFNFERTDSFSLSLKLRFTTSVSAEKILFAKWDNTNSRGFKFTVDSSGRPQVYIGNGATNRVIVRTSTVEVDDGDWHTICFTYAGSSAAAGVILYVDGVAATMTTVSDTLSATIAAAAIDINVGGLAAASSYTKARITQVVLYKRALSALEVFDLHYAGATSDITSIISSWTPSQTGYVDQRDFVDVGEDLWDPFDDTKGFIVRFEGLDRTDGKTFIEQELMLPLGCFSPVYSSGALGLRRMANVLAGAAYVALLDENSIVKFGELKHDFNSLHNIIDIRWNYEPLYKATTRQTVIVDADSVIIHGSADPYKWQFKGLHGSRHSTAYLNQRFDMIRDRYTGPPLRMTVSVLPSKNFLEVGDVVRVKLDNVRDFVANDTLDRSFEIQHTQMDWMTGEITLELFASSRAPGEVAPSSDATVLTEAWYTGTGTALSSVLTISGSNPGHVTVGGTLTGTADMNAAASIFYYDGDLQIDSGVTVNIVGNVQLRVAGFFQNNGTISGVGAGLAGAVAPTAPAGGSYTNNTPPLNWSAPAATAMAYGTSGFLGATESAGNVKWYQSMWSDLDGLVVRGKYSAVPAAQLAWDGTTLDGIFSDMRGTSGSSGCHGYGYAVNTSPSKNSTVRGGWLKYAQGGNGGASGAGLCIVCRGLAQGASAKINLSGGAGSSGAFQNFFFYFGDDIGGVGGGFYAGSGAGGAPGGLLVLLDGAGNTATGLTATGFVADWGSTPILSEELADPEWNHNYDYWYFRTYSYYVGTGDGTLFPLPSLSGTRGGCRVQYVPADSTVEEDAPALTLSPPTSVTLSSGTDELLLLQDGTIVPRIKVTWSASTDPRALGYEVQFKQSSLSIWQDNPFVRGIDSTTAWISAARDGSTYDVRIRSAGDVRRVSAWVTVEDHFVVGKSQPPDDVVSFTIAGTTLSWSEVSDVDLDGYLLRYQPGTSRSWGDAIQLHNGVVTNSPYDMIVMPTGSVTLMIKALDSSGNESVNAAYIAVDLGAPDTANIVETFDIQAAGFTGTKTACSVSGGDLIADSITPVAWKPDDTTAWWSADPATAMWATVQYAAMTYEDGIQVTQAGTGSHMTIQSSITGDPWSIEYCEDTGSAAWSSVDSTLWWNASSLTAFWGERQFLPWPGQVDVKNIFYAFRINAGQANVQGQVTEFTILIDMPDIEEFFDDIVIASGGTRLPITQTYRAIKNVQLTVQADGGTAISARTEDKDATLGPLVHGLDAAGSNTSALVDARVQGY